MDKLIWATLATIAATKLTLDDQDLNAYFYIPAFTVMFSILLDIRIRYDWYVVFKVGDATLSIVVTNWNDINDWNDLYYLRREIHESFMPQIVFFKKIDWHIVLKRNGRSD